MNVDLVAETIVAELQGHEVELWIIDTKQRAQLGSVKSENDNDEVTAWLDLLDVIKEQAGVKDLLITTHFGHRNEHTRGASSMLGWAEANWKLTNDDGRRQLDAEGRDVDQAPWALKFEPETRRLSLSGGVRVIPDHGEDRLRLRALMVVRIVIGQEGIAGKELHSRLTTWCAIGRGPVEAIVQT